VVVVVDEVAEMDEPQVGTGAAVLGGVQMTAKTEHPMVYLQ